ncbi:MAG: hypothetical protein Solumvirus2_1, partial [Solumvirus sp.]
MSTASSGLNIASGATKDNKDVKTKTPETITSVVIDKLVLPKPYEKVVESVEKLYKTQELPYDPTFTFDDHGRLLLSYIKPRNFTKFLIDGYNNMINVKLRKFFKEYKFYLDSLNRVEITDIKYQKPIYATSGKSKDLLPSEALGTDKTYGASIIAIIQVQK